MTATLLKYPLLKDVKGWAHDEDTVIDKIIDLTSYYVKLSPKEIRLDRARKEENKIIYKLIFDK